MIRSKYLLAVAGTALLAGCAQQPLGPSVAVMPAPNKPFDVFQQEQALCEQYASQQVAGQSQADNSKAVGAAVLGTVLGAGLGAAVGGGEGAGIGAATGALGGTAIGASQSNGGQGSLQRRYDIAYEQCMYSHGNQLPGYSGYTSQRRQAPSYPPPPPSSSGSYGGYPPPPPPPPMN